MRKVKGVVAYELVVALAAVFFVLGIVGVYSNFFEQEVEASQLSKYDGQIYDGTVSMMNGETHIYNFGSATPTVPYLRFYNRVTKQIYNSTAGALGAKASVAWADSGVLMIDETATVGGWLIVVPVEDNMANGWYDILPYERVGGAPASSDPMYKGKGRSCYIHNGILVSFDIR